MEDERAGARRLLTDLVGALQGEGGGLGSGVSAGMHDCERAITIRPLADRCKVGEADGRIDALVGSGAPATERDDRKPDLARRDRLDDPGLLGEHGAPDGSAGEVPAGRVEQALGASERGHHALKNLGGVARRDRGLDLRRALRRIGGEASEYQELGRKRHGDGVEAGRGSPSGEVVEHERDLERVAGCGRQRLVHIGEKGAGRQTRALRDRTQAFGQGTGGIRLGHEGA